MGFNPKAKMDADKARELHRLRGAGYTYPMLCREFGISGTQVGRILSGEQWHDVWLEFHDPAALNARDLAKVVEVPQGKKEQLDELWETLVVPAASKPDDPPTNT